MSPTDESAALQHEVVQLRHSEETLLRELAQLSANAQAEREASAATVREQAERIAAQERQLEQEQARVWAVECHSQALEEAHSIAFARLELSGDESQDPFELMAESASQGVKTAASRWLSRALARGLVPHLSRCVRCWQTRLEAQRNGCEAVRASLAHMLGETRRSSLQTWCTNASKSKLKSKKAKRQKNRAVQALCRLQGKFQRAELSEQFESWVRNMRVACVQLQAARILLYVAAPRWPGRVGNCWHNWREGVMQEQIAMLQAEMALTQRAWRTSRQSSTAALHAGAARLIVRALGHALHQLQNQLQLWCQRAKLQQAQGRRLERQRVLLRRAITRGLGAAQARAVTSWASNSSRAISSQERAIWRISAVLQLSSKPELTAILGAWCRNSYRNQALEMRWQLVELERSERTLLRQLSEAKALQLLQRAVGSSLLARPAAAVAGWKWNIWSTRSRIRALKLISRVLRRLECYTLWMAVLGWRHNYNMDPPAMLLVELECTRRQSAESIIQLREELANAEGANSVLQASLAPLQTLHELTAAHCAQLQSSGARVGWRVLRRVWNRSCDQMVAASIHRWTRNSLEAVVGCLAEEGALLEAQVEFFQQADKLDTAQESLENSNAALASATSAHQAEKAVRTELEHELGRLAHQLQQVSSSLQCSRKECRNWKALYESALDAGHVSHQAPQQELTEPMNEPAERSLSMLEQTQLENKLEMHATRHALNHQGEDAPCTKQALRATEPPEDRVIAELCEKMNGELASGMHDLAGANHVSLAMAKILAIQ